MFDRKTVFILGAGASWHYNYPTGDDLVSCVLSKTENLINCYKRDNGRGISNTINVICNVMGEETGYQSVIDFLQNFYDRLKYVNPPVIDYFFHSNEDLRDIGKLMIAWVVLEREAEFEKHGNLNREEDRDPVRRERHSVKDDWYRFILYKMLLGCNSYDDVFNNNVSFITFNYDVSLDHFLYKGLKQISFMKSTMVNTNKVKDDLRKRIHHVYGFVRDNDQFSEIDKAFVKVTDETVRGKEPIVTAAYNASQSIDTIAGQKRVIPEDVLEKIAKAQDVYILGFGFDALNCDGLKAKEYLGFGSSKKYIQNQDYRNVFFTNFGDHNTVNKKVSKLFTLPNKNQFLSGSGMPIFSDYFAIPETGRTGGLLYEKSMKNVYDALSQDFDFI